MTQDFSKGAAWMAGDVIPIHEAKIGVTDWGLTHSDIVYDVVPVRDGAFFRFQDHLSRFATSLVEGRMDVGLTTEDIADALHRMVAASGLQSAYVAMVASRGTPMIPGNRDPRACANHFYAWCVPYVHVIKPEVAEVGADVLLSDEVRRIPEDSVNPTVKNYHWGDFTRGLFEAKDKGFETVLLADHAGNATEGPGFNLFACKGKTVITPERGVLKGITRHTVMEMAAAEGFDVEERALPVSELMEADEVFLSSSGGGVLPVRRINDRVFSNGSAGPVALRLRQRYFELTCDPAYRTEISYVKTASA
ncbi:MAG: aminotransferase class IV [Pseudomonadota bacterium]